ncbi:MAG TPA: DUF1360 domain-containing protein [Mycobacteriales bacterium]|nr:DUF1360 domain-containing protein [Mycobacteriales bacterium]
MRVMQRIQAEGAEYSDGAERQLGSRAVTIGVYAATLAGLAAAVRGRRAEIAEQIDWRDLGLVALASFRLSRTIAKDSVASPVRAPFTRFEGVSGPAELKESPRGHGWRHTIGELITCPFCLDQWVSTGFVGGLVLAPRVTRVLAAVFAVRGLADAGQLGYAWLEHRAE